MPLTSSLPRLLVLMLLFVFVDVEIHVVDINSWLTKCHNVTLALAIISDDPDARLIP